MLKDLRLHGTVDQISTVRLFQFENSHVNSSHGRFQKVQRRFLKTNKIKLTFIVLLIALVFDSCLVLVSLYYICIICWWWYVRPWNVAYSVYSESFLVFTVHPWLVFTTEHAQWHHSISAMTTGRIFKGNGGCKIRLRHGGWRTGKKLELKTDRGGLWEQNREEGRMFTVTVDASAETDVMTVVIIIQNLFKYTSIWIIYDSGAS